MKRRCGRLVVAAFLALTAAVGVASAGPPIFAREYVRSSGKPAATSDPFAVCDPQGSFRIVLLNGPVGTRRVSSGQVRVNGALVIAESEFSQQVERIEKPLTNIVPDNRLDVSLASGPGATISIVIEGTQRCQAVLIDEPAAGATATEPAVVVRGTIVGSLGDELGVMVNGVAAFTHDGVFAALVPIDPSVTKLTAAIVGSGGVVASQEIPITVSSGDAGGERLPRHRAPGRFGSAASRAPRDQRSGAAARPRRLRR